MAEKRRDSKGRILRTGESQRKDGRYAYKYTDSTGKPQFVYAWKLVATDKTPAGKRDDISLREKEKEINQDIADGIDTVGKKMTVCQLYAKQNSQRMDVKRGTKKQREYLMGLLRDDPLGGKSIDAVKPSDAKEWAIRMREKGFSFQSISNYKRSLRAAFFIAIEDDCVRKNPFSFALNKVLEDDRGEKTVLTPEQEVSLIDFAQNDPVYQKYADELIILLGTGLRISEFCGLTTNLDFRNRLIRVDHQLLRDSENGYYIETPKTKNGYREIPMSEPVYRALKRVVKNRGKKATIMVDGYTDFLFLNQDGLPKVRMNYNNMVRGLVKKYNKKHKEPLSNITPHSLRHSCASLLLANGVPLKHIQEWLGHSDFTTTADIYAHLDYRSKITLAQGMETGLALPESGNFGSKWSNMT